MKIPLVRAEKLWHLGSIDVANAAMDSQEGNLLSVSACPEAWSSICRLGGRDVHETTKALLLVDLLALLFDEKWASNRRAIESYGLSKGLLERTSGYEVTWFDDEMESNMRMLFSDLESAEEEAEDWKNIAQVDLLVATPYLLELHRQRPRELSEGIEFAAIEWVREVAGRSVAGVYWDERHDPLIYSSPRGGLFPHAYASLVKVDSYPDDEVGLSMIQATKSLDLDDGYGLG